MKIVNLQTQTHQRSAHILCWTCVCDRDHASARAVAVWRMCVIFAPDELSGGCAAGRGAEFADGAGERADNSQRADGSGQLDGRISWVILVKGVEYDPRKISQTGLTQRALWLRAT